jgi:hypothetical protein
MEVSDAGTDESAPDPTGESKAGLTTATVNYDTCLIGVLTALPDE